ncbi:MAG: Gfo/Idh/MocA family oxidoreductase [Balneolaceae bacterium]|nr:Gfo/Idh/MocA family oxidoreductase [Balneolaceae bacterium]
MGYRSNRRDFIKTITAAGAGLSVAPFSILKARDNHTVRIGIIGVGARGSGHLRGLLQLDAVEVPAICDVDEENAQRAVEIAKEQGQDAPDLYTKGETDYKRLLARDDLDGIIVATPWLWHVPMAVDAMKAGKYVGLEVPAAVSIDGCWDLVNTSEETGMPCMLLENVCYRRDVMAILNMVRQGLFGELIHARCGYQHNLIPYLFDENANFGPGTGSVSSWRTQHYINRNGDLYPTHGIGPVAHWMDINRGNRFLTLTATATKARGLHDHIVEEGGKDHPRADVEFNQGDIVTSTITTANGESIIVTHDTSLPRPYSLGFRCQGTNGIWNVENNSIYLHGISPEFDQWESFDKYQDKYDSAIWKAQEQEAAESGHGGIDYFVRNAFVQSIRNGVNTPIDVYDAAAWSVISPLSEESVAQGGHPVDFPDFTDGKWMTNERIFKPEK